MTAIRLMYIPSSVAQKSPPLLLHRHLLTGDKCQRAGPISYEPADIEPLQRVPPRCGAQPARVLRPAYHVLHSLNQICDIGVNKSCDAVLDSRHHLGGCQTDNRHSDHHGLTDSEAQAGVSNWI